MNMAAGHITGYVIRRGTKQMIIENLSHLDTDDLIIGAIKRTGQHQNQATNTGFDTHPEIKESHLKPSAISPAKITGFATRRKSNGDSKPAETAWAADKGEMKSGHKISGVATRTELANGQSMAGWLPAPLRVSKKGKRKKLKPVKLNSHFRNDGIDSPSGSEGQIENELKIRSKAPPAKKARLKKKK
jgi:hypothetical protein